jgi:hypothetical protein
VYLGGERTIWNDFFFLARLFLLSFYLFRSFDVLFVLPSSSHPHVRPKVLVVIVCVVHANPHWELLVKDFYHSVRKMVSLVRTLRSIRRVGLREWWRQMQYIGDAKSGRLVGSDQ